MTSRLGLYAGVEVPARIGSGRKGSSGEHVLSLYRGVRPCAEHVCIRAVRAICAAHLGSPLLLICVLVRAQVQCSCFLQDVVVVSSEAKNR